MITPNEQIESIKIAIDVLDGNDVYTREEKSKARGNLITILSTVESAMEMIKQFEKFTYGFV